MSKNEPEKIHIPTFYTPGLFWFIFDKDITEKNAFNQRLQKKMLRYNMCENPKVGQFVAIRQNNLWVRAEVRLIQENTQQNQRSIIVTLLDEGICRRVHTVYELPRDMQSTPPFANKGMIYGILSTKTNFDLVDQKEKHLPLDYWQVGAMSKIRDIIKQQFVILKFVKKLFVKEMGNLLAGDLYIWPPDENEFNLADLLVKDGRATYSETDFKINLLQNGVDSDVQLILRELGEPKPRELEMKSSDVPLLRQERNLRSLSMPRSKISDGDEHDCSSESENRHRHQSRYDRRNKEECELNEDKKPRNHNRNRDERNRNEEMENRNRLSEERYGLHELNRKFDNYNRDSDEHNRNPKTIESSNRRSDEYIRRSDEYNRRSDEYNRRSNDSKTKPNYGDPRKYFDHPLKLEKVESDIEEKSQNRGYNDRSQNRDYDDRQRNRGYDDRQKSRGYDDRFQRRSCDDRSQNKDERIQNRCYDERSQNEGQRNRSYDNKNERDQRKSFDSNNDRTIASNRSRNDTDEDTSEFSDISERQHRELTKSIDYLCQQKNKQVPMVHDLENKTDDQRNNKRFKNLTKLKNKKSYQKVDLRDKINEVKSEKGNEVERYNVNYGRSEDNYGRVQPKSRRSYEDNRNYEDKITDRYELSRQRSFVKDKSLRNDFNHQKSPHDNSTKTIGYCSNNQVKMSNITKQMYTLYKDKDRDPENDDSFHSRTKISPPGRGRGFSRSLSHSKDSDSIISDMSSQNPEDYEDADIDKSKSNRLDLIKKLEVLKRRSNESKLSDSLNISDGFDKIKSHSTPERELKSSFANKDSESKEGRKVVFLPGGISMGIRSRDKKRSQSVSREQNDRNNRRDRSLPRCFNKANENKNRNCDDNYNRNYRSREPFRGFLPISRLSDTQMEDDKEVKPKSIKKMVNKPNDDHMFNIMRELNRSGEVKTYFTNMSEKSFQSIEDENFNKSSKSHELNKKSEDKSFEMNKKSGKSQKSDEMNKNQGKSLYRSDEINKNESDEMNKKSRKAKSDAVNKKSKEFIKKSDEPQKKSFESLNRSCESSSNYRKKVDTSVDPVKKSDDSFFQFVDSKNKSVDLSKKSVNSVEQSDESSLKSEEFSLKSDDSRKKTVDSSIQSDKLQSKYEEPTKTESSSLYKTIKNSLKGFMMTEKVTEDNFEEGSITSEPVSISCKSQGEDAGGIQIANPFTPNRAMAVAAGKCFCENCTKWTDTNEYYFKEILATKLEKKVSNKPIEPPSLLLKTNFDDSQEIKLRMKRKCYDSRIDQFISPKVLVHFDGNLIPARSLGEAPLHTLINKALHTMKIEHINRMQAYTWPAVVHCDNTFIINGPKTGKKLSYLPSLCSNIISPRHEELNDVRLGPYAIILVPNVKSGNAVLSYVFELYSHVRYKPKITLALPPLSNRIKNDISNGVELLITTPRTLLKLIESDDMTLKRLVHIVLQGGDVLFDKFGQEVEFILELIQKMLKKRTFAVTIQMILVAELWTRSIENLAKRLTMFPNICIGSYVEAALYGRTDIQVHLYNSQVKIHRVEDLIKNNYKSNKTIIICSTQQEVEEVYDTLNKYDIIKTEENSNLEEQHMLEKQWNSKKFGHYEILLGTDELFRTSVPLSITDATIVIQYSLPETVLKFTKRFMFFLDNQIGPFIEYDNENPMKCKMHLFVDENSSEQFSRIVNLILRFGTQLSDDVKNTYMSILKHREHVKIENKINLCMNIKLLGQCNELDTCKERHRISPELDINTNLPQSGIIKLRILSTQTVTHYSARLIEHIDSDGVKHVLKDKYSEIAMKLTMKLTNVRNRKPVYDVQIGTICAVEESHNLFRRCKVVSFLKFGIMNQPERVRVKLIDVGSVMNVSIYSLFAITDDLIDIPPQAVDIILENLGPLDGDTQWSDFCKSRLDRLLNEAGFEEPNCYFSGRIKLQLGNCFWVNNLILREYAPDGSLEVFKFSASKTLLDQNLVEQRPRHMEKLYEYCISGNIELPDYTLPVVKRKVGIPKQVDPTWAHLENYEDFNMVYFCSADSPNQFFIRICKHQTSFDRMIDQIQEIIQRPHYPTDFPVIEGRCYLAKDPQGGSYSRVLIKKLDGDNAECFFVDYGDYSTIKKSELKYLSDEFITILPFQVIECELYGIKPIGDEWSDESVDFLYDLAFENSDILRFLHVKVMDKSSGNVTDGSKYSVILIDTTEDELIINNELINKNLALPIDDIETIAVDFDKLKLNYSNNVEDSDDDFQYTVDDINEPPPTNQDDCESLEGSEKVFDIQINDFIGFLRGGVVETKQEPYVSRDTPLDDVPMILPSEMPDHSTPTVEWSETETRVELKIKLPGVLKYRVVCIHNACLHFQTLLNDTNYKLNLTLNSKAKLIKHEAKAFYVYVLLEKSLAGLWQKLVAGKHKLGYVHYDPEKIRNVKVVPEKVEIPFLFNESDKPKYVFEYGSDYDYDISDAESVNSNDIPCDNLLPQITL